MWVRENLEDVKSDMSAFHRVDDITRMPARDFYPRAERLVGYNGITRRRIQAEKEREMESNPSRGGSFPHSTQKNVAPESTFLAEHERDGWAERASS